LKDCVPAHEVTSEFNRQCGNAAPLTVTFLLVCRKKIKTELGILIRPLYTYVCSPIVDCGCLSDIPDLGDVGRLGQSQAATLQSTATVCQGVINLAQEGSCAVCPGAVHKILSESAEQMMREAHTINTGSRC
jgi:hypothetical protein